MRSRAFKTVKLITTAGVVAALCGGAVQAAAGVNNPGILPPNSTPGDLSYPEWHIVCLNWVLSMPAEINPLLQVDDPAELANPAPHPLWFGPYDVSVGQSGKVWVLPGAYATVVREATIPAGRTLCIPLLNQVVLGLPPIPAAIAFYRSYEKLVIDTAEISCEIDGVPVANLELYRHQSPAVPVFLPEDNLLGAPAGPFGIIVDDGYYLILAPLSVGTHTIHWKYSVDIIPLWNPQKGETQPPRPYAVNTQEITYNITVTSSD